jgi:hydrogenase-1 operon protein HyaE
MHPLIAVLGERYGLPTVDEATIDAFLAPAEGEPPHTLLFFTGDPEQRADTTDVAVVLPELLAVFEGSFRAAVVARAAEEKLKARFHVQVLPSLAVTRGPEPIGVLPRIRDWADYVATLLGLLDPSTPVLGPAQSRILITHSGRRTDA